MNHKHFTIEERESILEFLTLKKSIGYIAKKLNINRSSVYREILLMESIALIKHKSYTRKGK